MRLMMHIKYELITAVRGRRCLNPTWAIIINGNIAGYTQAIEGLLE